MSKVPVIALYKITNLVNGKFYIGATKDIHRRWNEHKSRYKKMNNDMYKDMRKQGLDEFEFKVIKKCTEETLRAQEKAYIKNNAPNYNKVSTIGYNALVEYSKINGDPRRKPCMCIETGKIFDSIKVAAFSLNIDEGSISRVCRGLRLHAGKLTFRYLKGGN